MKLSSKSANRPLALALVIGSALSFSVVGVTHAQYGTSEPGTSAGQGGSTGQREAAPPSGTDKYGMPKEQQHMDTGYVDQKKRVERNKDPASPSKDPHVPEFQRDKEGRPMKDPMYEQGGPIGPN